MNAPKVDCVLDAHAQVGEGAVWSVAEQALFWVDIPAGRVHRFDPQTAVSRSWDMGCPVGCFALTASGGAVVALTSGFHELSFADGALKKLSGPQPGAAGHRFNDGSVDLRGRFLAGTMPLNGVDPALGAEGTLYSLDADNTLHELMSGFYVINGLAFSPDGKTAYVSDSYPPVRTIWSYDYDLDSGQWSNQRVFFDSRAVAGRPDGGAIDADGCYWMAGVGGWQLVRITPAGRVDRQIPMPVEKPTRIAFGGADLDTLYVTSISAGLDPESAARQPQAGGVFALRVPGVTGIEMPRMRR